MKAHALAAVAPAAKGRGDDAAARAALTEAMRIYETAGSVRGVVVTSLDLAELATTPPAEARALSQRALENAKAASFPADEARARLLLAKLAKAEGDWQTALIETEAARDLERRLYDEETQRRVQAVRARQEIDDLNRELSREPKRRVARRLPCLGSLRMTSAMGCRASLAVWNWRKIYCKMVGWWKTLARCWIWRDELPSICLRCCCA